jgi:hypothetical protein
VLRVIYLAFFHNSKDTKYKFVIGVPWEHQIDKSQEDETTEVTKQETEEPRVFYFVTMGTLPLES